MVAVNAYFDSTASYDCFGTIRLLIDGTEQARAKFGARTSTGETVALFPISLIGTASGNSSTNIRVEAWNSNWANATGVSRPFYLRDLKLTVSGTKR